MKTKRTGRHLAAAFVLGLLVWGGAAVNVLAADIEINETNFPDANFRSSLRELDAGSDGIFTADEIAGITEIYVGYSDISSLEGIQYFTELTNLNCEENALTSLDVSRNTKLTTLWCRYNNLTDLNLDANTALTELWCDNNQLTSLDVSKNTALVQLECGSNALTALDVSGNAALNCLGCSDEKLTSLDVSKNTALEYLYCYKNSLTSLDVSKNKALKILNCENNSLTDLDVSVNTELTKLWCGTNQLTSLDVSQNKALDTLGCSGNQLTDLDVSVNTALKSLNCLDNRLKTLYLAKDAALLNLKYDDGVTVCRCTHTFKTTKTKATLKKDGSVKTACKICGKVTDEKTISYPKTFKLSAAAYTYDGKSKKPSVEVTDAEGNRISSKNYKLTYESGRKKVGKYTVKVTFNGNYSGTKKLSFKINPKGTSISKITAGSRKLTVKWKKQTAQTTGYQIQVSLKKKFTSLAADVKVTKTKTTSEVVQKLRAKKKYYVRIRTYKTVNGKNYTSAWSDVKSAATKK